MEPPIISRADAEAAGLKRFFTGEPCRNGHVSERRVGGDGSCFVCQRMASATYRKSDPEGNKARRGAWDKANMEKIRAQKRARYAANLDAERARNAKWYKENLEYNAARKLAWRKANPAAVCARSANRRAKLRSVDGHHTAKDIDALLERQKSRCANSLCKKSLKNGYHADHIMPLKLGGGNSIRNIQLLCAPCNLGKSAKHPIDWARSHGALL